MKTLLTITFFLLLTPFAFGHDAMWETKKTVTQTGIGFGSVIAIVASWDRNRSIIWAIIHGAFGWLYVIYFALTRNKHEELDED